MGRPKKKISKRALIVRKYLRHGDMFKISAKAEMSTSYVRQVLQAVRWNRRVLSIAIEIAKQNRALGLANV